MINSQDICSQLTVPVLPKRSVRAYVIVSRLLISSLSFLASFILDSETCAQGNPSALSNGTNLTGITNATSLGNFNVKAGQANLINSPATSQVIIQQTTNQAVLNWNRLNIPQSSSIQFIQPSSQSVVLNRVYGGSTSLIDGSIIANGQVWILNPAGVLFGPSSQVNVQGLLASTAGISNKDFLSGNYTLLQKGVGTGVVSNAGVISVADGGYVVLAANQVQNSGQITAQLGEVALGSGRAYTLDIAGDRLINFDVTSALNKVNTADGRALIDNSGTITANGGVVQMTARAANDFVGSVINTGGVVQANTVRNVQGQIYIDGSGSVSVDGTLSASASKLGSQAGNVSVTGDKINLTNNASVLATGESGGGNVLIGGDARGQGPLTQASQVVMARGALIDTSAIVNGNAGQVVLWSNTSNPNALTSVAGTIRAQGGSASGNGGSVETSGANLKISDSASVFTNPRSANGKGGVWLLDPQDFTIAASNGDITGATISSNLSNGSVTILSSTGATSGLGNIYVNDSISWTSNTLTLNAANNIYINAPLYGSGPASLIALYGQNALPAGNSSNFFVNAPINLSAGHTLSTTLGVGGTPINYTVIVDLGVQQDATLFSTLQGVTNSLSASFALGSNIDATATSGWNGGAGFTPIGTSGASAFSGNFNGLGHTISNLTINSPSGINLGLFGVNTGSISNVVLSGGSVSGYQNVGSLVGVNYGGTVFNATTSTAVSGHNSGGYSNNVGGLVGLNQSTTSAALIQYSTSSSAVSGVNSVGGLVGSMDSGTAFDAKIYQSSSSSNVTGAGISVGGLVGGSYSSGTATSLVDKSFATGSVNGLYIVGGLIGSVEAVGAASSVTNSYSTGSVTSTSTSKSNQDPQLGGATGGLVGWLHGEGSATALINNSYSSSNVTGPTNIGGLVGTILVKDGTATVSNSNASGSVGSPTTTGLNFGGLVGTIIEGAIANSYDTTVNITNNYATGSVGNTSGNASGLIGAVTFYHKTNFYLTSNYSTGNVTSSGYGVGGLIGTADMNGSLGNGPANIYIQNNYTTGAITGAGGVGGLVGSFWNGWGNNFIFNNYSTSNVTGTNATGTVGGLFGDNQSTFSNSYATGLVIGSAGYIGGLIGHNYGSMSNSYWNTTSSGLANAVGTGTLTGGVGLSSANALVQASYSGFDFANAWTLYAGYTTPLLNAFLTPLTVTATSPSGLTQVYNASSAYTLGQTIAYSVTPNSNLMGSLSYTLSSANVGTQSVNMGGYYSNQQGYQITYVNNINNITITPAPLMITGGNTNAVYNAATQSTPAATVVGLKGVDTVSVTGYASAINAGTYTDNLAAVAGGGTSLSNYSIAYVNGGLRISPAILTINGEVASSKTFDSTTQATVLTSNASLQGVVVGDAVALDTSSVAGVFTNSTAGVNKTVYVVGNTLTGTSAGNYVLIPPTLSATITPSQQVAQNINTVSQSTNLVNSPASNNSITNNLISTPTVSVVTSSNTSSGTNSSDPSTNNSSGPAATTPNNNNATPRPTTNNETSRVATITQTVVGSQIQAFSVGVVPSNSASVIGAQTIAPIRTPASSQDAADAVLSALPSFVPNTSSFRPKSASVAAKTPVIPSLLTLENVLPRAATQASDEGSLSASGNRSRW